MKLTKRSPVSLSRLSRMLYEKKLATNQMKNMARHWNLKKAGDRHIAEKKFSFPSSLQLWSE